MRTVTHVKGFWLVLGLLALLLGQSTADSNKSVPLNDGQAIKLLLEANAPEAARDNLLAQGAEMMVDYGAFSMWRLPSASTAAMMTGTAGLTMKPDMDRIWLRGGAFIDGASGREPDIPSTMNQAAAAGPQLSIVQFIGPVKDVWLANLKQAGFEIVMYLPSNAYVVWGDAEGLSRLRQSAQAETGIQWTGAYHPAYRLSPELYEAAMNDLNDPVDITVQLYRTASTQQSLAEIRSIASREYLGPEDILAFTNISLQVPAIYLETLASRPDVFNIEPWIQPQLMDEVQGQILAGNITSSGGKIVPSAPGYLDFLNSKGFPTTAASYPVVDIVDDGIDQGNASAVLHPDFYTFGVTSNPHRLSYIDNCTGSAKGNSVGGHGNLNAGIFGSYNNLAGSPYTDANGYRIGLGISPYGRIAGTRIFNNAGNFDISKCSNTYAGLIERSYTDGAALTSNSWGASVAGAYDAKCQTYDAMTRDASGSTTGNQQMLHIFSAGNNGFSSNTIGSAGTAKNVLTVGATENVREQGIADGCGISDADDADDIASYSSRGPTDDGRIKPDIVAPGTHVQGPASQDPGYDGSNVCNKYHPAAGQTLYAWSSGTSHSCPAVAGAASLAYEYYGRVINPGNTPSPAMLKALLLNSTRYLNATGGNLPTNAQGWGDADMGNLFSGNTRTVYDQRPADLFDSTGQTRTFTGSIASPGQPFRVTLVWTEPPGATTGNSYVNNLDLEVTVGGTTYKGNVFSGAYSTTGGSADERNNVESVFLQTVAAGEYSVKVTATNIAGDGVPGNADATDQDFALVIYKLEPGVISLTAPNGGESWNRNARRVITWNASGCSGTLKLTLWQNGGLIGTIADGVSPAAGSYAWAVGAYNGGVAPLGTGYTIKIEDNGSTLADESNAPFSIVKISVKTPNGGESWQKGSTQNITWVAKTISNNLRIVLFKDGVKVGNIVNSIDPALGTYSWTVGNYAGGTAAAGTGYQVQIREIGTDAGDRSDANFTLTPP